MIPNLLAYMTLCVVSSVMPLPIFRIILCLCLPRYSDTEFSQTFIKCELLAGIYASQAKLHV
jgi:hypothetical protein